MVMDDKDLDERDEAESDRGREFDRGRSDRRPLTAEEIILGDVVSNATRSGAKLKELLAGTILIKLIDSGQRYVIDWREGDLKAQPAGKDATADCTILVSEDHLKRISQGDLNPQMAMLSEKIRVEGRKAVAMYFFNLVAPHAAI
ncbi:MAG: hypothetical protein EBZ48_00985 [Proteobacteria bacterium]|nr:hypothetical protein [Pseudomonadota bacterium]